MIQGLHADVTGTELRLHLHNRADHHQRRAADYEAEVTRMEASQIEPMVYTGGDPVKALRDKCAEHATKAQEFRFLADHINTGETYRLTTSDLMTAEFVSRHRWY
jgi:hypothetical protein